MRLWAIATVVGVPDRLFWTLTAREVEAVLDRHAELERAANYRAGLVAATVVNVNLKKGAKPVQPRDFFDEGRDEEDFMSVEQASAALDLWAAQHNARVAAKHGAS